MTDNSFVADDTGSRLVVTCKDNDTGNVIDLSLASVSLRWRDAAGSLVSRNMTITDAPGGVVEYQFQEGELFAGVMGFEVRITDNTGKIISSLKVLHERVREPLA